MTTINLFSVGTIVIGIVVAVYLITKIIVVNYKAACEASRILAPSADAFSEMSEDIYHNHQECIRRYEELRQEFEDFRKHPPMGWS